MNLSTPRILASDEAENSIMQTISIAVSAILIAAGLITAPSLINNARDVNAKTDLANLSYAQEAALADTGHYYQNLNRGEVKSLAEYKSPETGKALVKYTTSGDVFNVAVACDSAFVLKTTSRSGKTFYRTSESTKITTSAPSLTEAGLADCYDGDATKVAGLEGRYDALKGLDLAVTASRPATAVQADLVKYTDAVADNGTSPVTGGSSAPVETPATPAAFPEHTTGLFWNQVRTADVTSQSGINWTFWDPRWYNGQVSGSWGASDIQRAQQYGPILLAGTGASHAMSNVHVWIDGQEVAVPQSGWTATEPHDTGVSDEYGRDSWVGLNIKYTGATNPLLGHQTGWDNQLTIQFTANGQTNYLDFTPSY